jgi:hypothetical protein
LRELRRGAYKSRLAPSLIILIENHQQHTTNNTTMQQTAVLTILVLLATKGLAMPTAIPNYA